MILAAACSSTSWPDAAMLIAFFALCAFGLWVISRD